MRAFAVHMACKHTAKGCLPAPEAACTPCASQTRSLQLHSQHPAVFLPNRRMSAWLWGALLQQHSQALCVHLAAHKTHEVAGSKETGLEMCELCCCELLASRA